MTRPQGLAAAALVLMAGGAAAQVLPLLLGPWLARLYAPAQWGAWALFAAVTANLAVIACARYDFALPLARDDDEAAALMALCLRIGIGVVAFVTIGTGLALLIGGVVVTESVFAVPGIGRLTIDAVMQRDYPVIQGVILVVAGVYVLVNLLIDLTYSLLDPRIRY